MSEADFAEGRPPLELLEGGENPGDPGDGRLPPHDTNAEMTVLGSFLCGVRIYPEALALLEREAFYEGKHGWIYLAITELIGEGTPVDISTVFSRLREMRRDAQVGGWIYLEELANRVPVLDDKRVTAYARAVKSCHARRKLIEASRTAMTKAYVSAEPTIEIVTELGSAIYDVTTMVTVGGARKTGADEIADKLLADLARADEGSVSGTRTGIERLDRMTGGVHLKEVRIVAARPGMGKSAFMIGEAGYLAGARRGPGGVHGLMQDPSGVGVFFSSMEMPSEQQIQRLGCQYASVDIQRWRGGMLTSAEKERLAIAVKFIRGLPIEVDDTRGISLLDLRAKVMHAALKLQRKGYPLKVVYVDYLQLLKAMGKHASREAAVAENARGLGWLADSLDVHITAASQLNREVGKRPNKRPTMTDIRESGEIEQVAHVIVFIHREDYFHKRQRSYVPTNIAEFIVEKQRNGPTGMVKARFEKECARFDNLPDGQEEDDDG